MVLGHNFDRFEYFDDYLCDADSILSVINSRTGMRLASYAEAAEGLYKVHLATEKALHKFSKEASGFFNVFTGIDLANSLGFSGKARGTSEISGLLSMVIFLLFALTTHSMALETPLYVIANVGSRVNVRNRPGMDGEIIGGFYFGEIVTPIGVEGDWIKIDEGGEEDHGYILSDFLSSSNGGEKSTAMVVSSGRVRIRKTPKASGKVVGYVRNGDTVLVSFIYQGWARTDKGWIDGEYLTGME
jgi:hypothetical protein